MQLIGSSLPNINMKIVCMFLFVIKAKYDKLNIIFCVINSSKVLQFSLILMCVTVSVTYTYYAYGLDIMIVYLHSFGRLTNSNKGFTFSNDHWLKCFFENQLKKGLYKT